MLAWFKKKKKKRQDDDSPLETSAEAPDQDIPPSPEEISQQQAQKEFSDSDPESIQTDPIVQESPATEPEPETEEEEVSGSLSWLVSKEEEPEEDEPLPVTEEEVADTSLQDHKIVDEALPPEVPTPDTETAPDEDDAHPIDSIPESLDEVEPLVEQQPEEDLPHDSASVHESLTELVVEEVDDELEEEPEPIEPPAPEPEIVQETKVPEKKKKESLFSRLTKRLGKTRESFTYQIDTLFLGKKEIDSALLDDLEEILITADLGVATTEELLDYTRRKLKRKELASPESLKNALKEQIKTFIVENEEDASLVMPDSGPFVIMVIGVNGVGKTTTIGKIAHKFINVGSSVLLVAGDTFRAAAISQLKIWGERNNVPVVAHKEGSDPSSVVFDALGIAEAKDIDVVLVDTAGRMHTKDNLMEELKKIKRVMSKKLPGAPHEILLVIDATTGQNAISQARLFDDAVKVTGLTLTKLDGTSKGGIVANICREMQIPIRFIGIGEQMDDLRDFDANEFVDALFQSNRDQK